MPRPHLCVFESWTRLDDGYYRAAAREHTSLFGSNTASEMSITCLRKSIRLFGYPHNLLTIMDISIGDQHKANGAATANPFEDVPSRMSEYTAQEIATLQSRLDKQLGPEYISSRPGAAGQKVHYLAAEKVINLANEVFGFNGWSSGIQNIQIDFVDENAQTGKITLGLSVIVRVTLKDGTFHEDIGYGHIENCKGKAAAFEKAKKEGTTDALKRALRNFGNLLGNCIYDKDFVAKVTKMKVAPSKWDAENLHRHSDYAPVKKEATANEDHPKPNEDSTHTTHAEIDDDFGIADFDDADFGESSTGHPDEIVLPADPPTNYRQQKPGPNPADIARNGMTTPSRPTNAGILTAPAAASRMPSGPTTVFNPQQRMQPPMTNTVHLQAGQTRPLPTNNQQQPSSDTHNSSSPGVPSQHFNPQPLQQRPLSEQAPQQAPPVGFYSARVAAQIVGDSNAPVAAPTSLPKFDPHAESPSIRKSAGIDHNRSVPVKRGLAGSTVVPAPLAQERAPVQASTSRDFVNPSTDMHRRIGAPGAGMQSPAGKGGMNASAYRPPTKRGPEPSPAGGGVTAIAQASDIRREPLGDVSNMKQSANNSGDGNDAKRQRITGPENGMPGHNLAGAR